MADAPHDNFQQKSLQGRGEVTVKITPNEALRNPAISHFMGPVDCKTCYKRLPMYRIEITNIRVLKIHVVIGGISLLADALLRGSSVSPLYVLCKYFRCCCFHQRRIYSGRG